jgi:hypothetical protein
LAPLAVGHSVREALPDASPETATELSPRECCASTLPAPVALVITEGRELGDAAVDDGVFDAGAGVVTAGLVTAGLVTAGVFAAGVDADPAADPAVDTAVDASRDGS